MKPGHQASDARARATDKVCETNELRAAELAEIVVHFPKNGRILEIGAGTGRQALELRQRGFDIAAIDIPDSNYAAERVFPIVDYDGRNIPFPDGSFDVVFSSNVLEHVQDLAQLHGEIRRVLGPGGACVHVLPTTVWRFWTSLAAFPAALLTAGKTAPRAADSALPARGAAVSAAALTAARLPLHVLGAIRQRRHGERGNVLTELWFFHPSWWRRNFRENLFDVVEDHPMRLFYTGYAFAGGPRSLSQMAKRATALGSAAHLFKLRVRAGRSGGP